VALSKTQATAFEKVRRRGAGNQGVSLSESAVRALVAIVARDLEIAPIAGIDPSDTGEFYETAADRLELDGNASAQSTYEALLAAGPPDTEMYFLSLATLHRARLKFANILRLQGTPSLEQVGPRGLLQYGDIETDSLGSLLILRKWMFDIDNRAGQETGYLFEPVIAGAVGGAPVSAKKSPVKRDGTGSGRQVDCLRGNDAYEIKIRVTIAASGQGRWQEELAFPADCRMSDYTPVLVVFDGTPNEKLLELKSAFEQCGGRAHVGEDAWAHLEEEAGDTMGRFIEKYIRAPLDDLLDKTPSDLPELRLRLQSDRVDLYVGATHWNVLRNGSDQSSSDEIPDDVDTTLPGLD